MTYIIISSSLIIIKLILFITDLYRYHVDLYLVISPVFALMIFKVRLKEINFQSFKDPL